MIYKLGDSNKWSADVKIYNHSYRFRYPCQDSFSECTYYVTLKSGSDIFETWGAEGGMEGGKGGYSRGIISFNRNQRIFLFIGSKGETKDVVFGEARPSFNSGRLNAPHSAPGYFLNNPN